MALVILRCSGRGVSNRAHTVRLSVSILLLALLLCTSACVPKSVSNLADYVVSDSASLELTEYTRSDLEEILAEARDGDDDAREFAATLKELGIARADGSMQLATLKDARFGDSEYDISSVSFSADGALVHVAHNRTNANVPPCVSSWQAGSGTLQRILLNEENAARCLALGADKAAFFLQVKTDSMQKIELFVLDLRTLESTQLASGPSFTLLAPIMPGLDFDPKARYLAGPFIDTGGSSHCIWDVASGQLLKRLPLPKAMSLKKGAPAVAFHNGNFIRLLPGASKPIEVYRISDWKSIGQYAAPDKHGGEIGEHVALSPDGSLLATTAAVYSTDQSEPICEGMFFSGPPLFPKNAEGLVGLTNIDVSTTITTQRGCYEASALFNDSDGELILWREIVDTAYEQRSGRLVTAGKVDDSMRVVPWKYEPLPGLEDGLRTMAQAIEYYKGGFQDKGVQMMRRFIDDHPRNVRQYGFTDNVVLSNGMPLSLIGRTYLNSMIGGPGNLDLLSAVASGSSRNMDALLPFAQLACRAGHPDITEQALDLFERSPDTRKDAYQKVDARLLRANLIAMRHGADAAYNEMIDWVPRLDTRQQLNALRNLRDPAFAPLHADRTKLAFLFDIELDKLPPAPVQPTPQPFWNLTGELVQPAGGAVGEIRTNAGTSPPAPRQQPSTAKQPEAILLD